MQARDIMTKALIVVSPGDTIQQLAKVLTDGGISGAPVIDDSGDLVGIVSEADVIGKRGVLVGDVMRRSVVTVPANTPVEQVCLTMSRNGINRVPVVGDGEIVGIITRTDIVRAIAQGNLAPDFTETLPVPGPQDAAP